MTTDLLKTSGVSAGYGDVQVLHDVDITVKAGEIVCLIGSNGAGKTTLLRTLSGMAKAVAGDITFAGQSLLGLSPQEIVRRGIAHVPEGRRLFAGMTVRENLLMGAYMRNDGRAVINKDLDFVLKTFPRLAERLNQDASTLSGGEQQMCAIGRAMMSRPKLILLDEPSMGLAPQVVEEIFEIVRDLNAREGVSFLLAEQNANMALRYASFGYILETGRVVLDGAAETLRSNEDVREFYLGVAGQNRRSFKTVKTYKRRKRWLA